MFRKLCLLAVACLSLAQVRGDENLEKAKATGQARVEDIFRKGIIDIENYRYLIERLEVETETEFDVLNYRMSLDADEFLDVIKAAAESLIEKAENSITIIQCIERFQAKGIENIDRVFREMAVQLVDQMAHAQNDLNSVNKTIQIWEEDFQGTFGQTIYKIYHSKDVSSVDYAVRMFESYVNKMRSDITWIIQELATFVDDFKKQLSSFYITLKGQTEKFKAQTCRNMRLCLFNRHDINELFLSSTKH